jgi:hypothetical protein
MVNFCAVCGCCTRIDIVREHLEDTLRICDVSAMGLLSIVTTGSYFSADCCIMRSVFFNLIFRPVQIINQIKTMQSIFSAKHFCINIPTKAPYYRSYISKHKFPSAPSSKGPPKRRKPLKCLDTGLLN